MKKTLTDPYRWTAVTWAFVILPAVILTFTLGVGWALLVGVVIFCVLKLTRGLKRGGT